MAQRKHRNKFLAGTTKVCPYCGEEIKAVAVKCRYCGEMLQGNSSCDVPRETQQQDPQQELVEWAKKVSKGDKDIEKLIIWSAKGLSAAVSILFVIGVVAFAVKGCNYFFTDSSNTSSDVGVVSKRLSEQEYDSIKIGMSFNSLKKILQGMDYTVEMEQESVWMDKQTVKSCIVVIPMQGSLTSRALVSITDGEVTSKSKYQ